mmetsp:Transcript_102281/g.176631  ORF Transcript_102281/g.176631 Transcript_102281/m.176631 type:complete len:571 (-) Transcript_102281:3640-5352(-)
MKFRAKTLKVPPKGDLEEVMGYIVPYFWRDADTPERLWLGAAGTGMVGRVVCKSIEPWAMKNILDSVSSQKSPATGLIIYGVCRVSREGFGLVRDVFWAKASLSARTRAMSQAMAHTQRATCDDGLAGAQVAAIVRGGQAMETLSTAMLVYLPMFTFQTTVTVGSFVATGQKSIFIISLILGGLLGLGPYVHEAHDADEDRVEYNVVQNQAAGVGTDSLENKETVHAYGGQGFEERRFGGLIRHSLLKLVDVRIKMATLYFVAGAYMNIADVITVCITAVQVANGQMTVGDLPLMIKLVDNLLEPLPAFAQWYGPVREETVTAQGMFHLTQLPLPAEPADPQELDVQEGRIVVQDVVVGDILRGVSVTLEPGTRTAVVGATGSGKTTLLRALTRFAAADSGTVHVDGTDLQRCSLDSIHRGMASGPQAPKVFAGTLWDNITYGLTGGPDDAPPAASAFPTLRAIVEAAVEATDLVQFIEGLPGGLGMDITEHRALISGGERQRITLARVLTRALATGAKIVLLDEPTSALDRRTGDAVLSNMYRHPAYLVALQHFDSFLLLPVNDILLLE